MESLLNLAPFLAIAVLFYLLLIRPQRRQQAEMAQMRQSEEERSRGNDRRHYGNGDDRPAGIRRSHHQG